MALSFKKFVRWTHAVKARRYGITKAQLQKVQQERGNLPLPPAGTARDGNRRGRKADNERSVRPKV